MMAQPLRIEVADKTAVTIEWDDGVVSHLGAAELRGACLCAGCREPAGEAATQAVLAGEPPVTIEEARLVGGYAVSFVFGPDNHGTGIYPFSALRSLAGGSTG